MAPGAQRLRELEGALSIMLRSLVRSRPICLPASTRPTTFLLDVLPCALRDGGRNAVILRALHATPPANKLGFKNFRGAPRLDWKVKQDLEGRDKLDAMQQPIRVKYAEGVRDPKTRKETWLGARKIIECGRLFGGAKGGPPPGLYDHQELATDGDKKEVAQQQ